MKLLILGESNEIRVNGYVKVLKEAWEVQNLAIGGCGSSAGIYNMLKCQPREAKFALLSFEVNEHITLEKGIRAEADIREAWSWLILKLRALGIIPVVLILPSARGGQFMVSAVRELKRKLASELQVHLIDLTDIFLKVESQGCSTEELMLDNSHPSDAVCEIFGRAIVRELEKLNAAPLRTRTSSHTSRDFRIIMLRDTHAGTHKVTPRKNSFAEGYFVTVDAGNPLFVQLAESECLWSVGLNRRAAGAKVEISNANERFLKSLCFCKERDEVGKFANIVTDFKHQLRGSSAGIQISIADKEGLVREHTVQGQHPFDDMYGVIEMEGVLVASLESTTSELEYLQPDRPLALLDGEAGSELASEILSHFVNR